MKTMKKALKRVVIVAMILGILTVLVLPSSGMNVYAGDIDAVEEYEEIVAFTVLSVLHNAQLFSSPGGTIAHGIIHAGAQVQVLEGPMLNRFQVRVLNAPGHNGWAGSIFWINRVTIGW